MKELSKEKSNGNYLRVERIETLMKRENFKYAQDFADRIDILPQNFSRAMQSGKISEKMCQKIINKFPEYRIEWLLGYDDIMLKSEFVNDILRRSEATDNATIQILDSAYREVCLREGLELQTLDNIPELLLLQAQLRDFADSLMWNYVKHREHSHVWSYLDHIGENK